jgi:hypothetical protein
MKLNFNVAISKTAVNTLLLGNSKTHNFHLEGTQGLKLLGVETVAASTAALA